LHTRLLQVVPVIPRVTLDDEADFVFTLDLKDERNDALANDGVCLGG